MYECSPPGMLAFLALQTKEEKPSYIKVEFPQSNKDTFT